MQPWTRIRSSRWEGRKPSHPARSAGSGSFDQIAATASHAVSRGPLFVVCVAGVLVWFALWMLTGFSYTWLAAGSAVMSVVIVVLVAVLENAQRRSDQAGQRKLNAVADALPDFMCQTHVDDQQVRELRTAVGVEHRESTRHDQAR